MTHFFFQSSPIISTKLKHLERWPLTLLAEVLALVIKVYHEKDEKSINKITRWWLRLSNWPQRLFLELEDHLVPAPNVVRKLTGPRIAQIPISLWAIFNVPSRTTLFSYLPPCTSCHEAIKHRLPPADLLGLLMDDWRDLDSPDPTTVISEREPWVNIVLSGWFISFLLYTDAIYSLLKEPREPTTPLLRIVRGKWGDSLTCFIRAYHSCIFRGVPLIHSFLVVPACRVPYWEENFFLLPFAWSQTSQWLLSSPSYPPTLLIPICHFLSGGPQVYDTPNPSVARHYSLTVKQLQDPTGYITQAKYPLPL